jgi:hypothetical protein
MSATPLDYADLASPQPWAASPSLGEPIVAAIPQEPEPLNPWRVIFLVGGLVWAAVTALALFWLLPWAATRLTTGEYVASTFAHGVQHVFVFLMAACAYRLALYMGWPATLGARIRVAAVNLLLAVGVSFWADTCVTLVTGFVDGHWADMHHMLAEMPDFLKSAAIWATPLRFFALPYGLGLTAVSLVMAADRNRRQALRSAQLASAYAEARMAMLSAQLQPHFLFNSLHAVMGLIDESPRQASTMLARLGDFLRHALETSHSPWVDLGTELAGLEAYLAVQRTRFEGRLDARIEASAAALRTYVPSLLLQPLAENAIEHGRNDSGPALIVRVTAEILDERLCICISNSSPRLRAPLTPSDYGRGLTNVSLRLRAAYEDEARLMIGPDTQRGTKAVLSLPLRSALRAKCAHV